MDMYKDFPLTPIQEAYWVGRSSDMTMGSVSTHTYVEIETKDLDISKLEFALNRLIERHPMLRAIISDFGSQKILEKVPHYTIETIDLRENQTQDYFEHIEKFRSILSHQVLKSDQWPLFDIRAIILDNEKARLFLSFDLLIIDGRSLDLFSNEWYELYHNPNASLPDIENTFYNYVLAQKALKQEESYKKDAEYWHNCIQSLPDAPNLPRANHPVASDTRKFVRFEDHLDVSEWKMLKNEIAKRGLRTTAFLITVFAEVLRVWSENSKMTLNLTQVDHIAKRAEYENVLGEFASTLLLAVDLENNFTLEERVLHIQKKLYSDLKHRNFSGIDVLRELAKSIEPQKRSDILMPIVFTRQQSKGTKGSGSSRMAWLGKSIYKISQTPQVFIDYQLFEYGDGFTVLWDTPAGIFPDDMVKEMFNAHMRLLRQLAKDPSVWLKKAHDITSIILPASHADIYKKINSTTSTISTSKLLYDDFLHYAKTNPDKPAIILEHRTLTYADLERESAIVATWLQEQGVQPNQLVAIVMAKSWEQVAAVLGVLRAGAAYLPLDPVLPKKRLDYLFEHGNIKYILSLPCWNESIEWPAYAKTFIIFDGTCMAKKDLLKTKQPVRKAKSNDLAYVVYTSGSTGLPKGVMISHKSALNTIDSIIDNFSINSDDKILAASSLSFDLSVFDIFGMLSVGATIVIPILDQIKDPVVWLDFIHKYKITIWNSVPTLMQLLCEFTSQQKDNFESLRLILLSGDWIPLQLPKQIRSLSQNAEIISLGGATEASIWSILYKIDKVDPLWNSIPYGYPMQNQHIYILDENLELCPVWVPGEICIGGMGVALGYWKDQKLTETSFIIHPNTQERLYKTGDIGRLHKDGFIEFLGRKDHQLKIRGFRVEAGEIETVLEQHAKVKKAIVVPVSTNTEQNHLIAYVSLEYNTALNKEELKSFVREQLPNYMQLSDFIVVENFPLSSNGKIDRKALAELNETKGDTNPIASQELSSDTLNRLMKNIVNLLSSQNINPNDSFLDLGATSIDIIRLINHIDQEFDLRLKPDHIYDAKNIIELAKIIEEKINQSLTSHNGNSRFLKSSSSNAILLDPLDRENFRNSLQGLRSNLNDRTSIDLPNTGIDPSFLDILRKRKSHRHFLDTPVKLNDISKLFKCLQGRKENTKHKYFYGSAGTLYPVQTYIYVKEDCVQHLGKGAYYYHPLEHSFIQISTQIEIGSEIYDPMINRPIFDEAAFVIFLIVDLSAILPMYGERSLHYSTIEAGLMTQILEENAVPSNLGLCQIGDLDFDKLNSMFELGENHVLLHSLLAGALQP